MFFIPNTNDHVVKIVAISGFKGSGKDSVADIVVDHTGENEFRTKVAFADPIHDVFESVFHETLRGDSYFKKTENNQLLSTKKNTVTNREVINRLGDMLRNEFGSNVLNNSFGLKIENMCKMSNQPHRLVFVISDVRYRREFRYLTELKSYGFDVEHWLVLRKNALPDWCFSGLNVGTKIERDIILNDFKPTKPEIEWCFLNPKFDKVITNDGNLSDLEKQIANIAEAV